MVGRMSVVRGAWEPGVEEGFPQVWFPGLLVIGWGLCFLYVCDFERKLLCPHPRASRKLESRGCIRPPSLYCRLS